MTQRRCRTSTIVLGWLSLLATLAAPEVVQGQSVPDLTLISLEDLMNIQVTTAAKKAQSLSQTASAVFVVTPRRTCARRSARPCVAGEPTRTGDDKKSVSPFRRRGPCGCACCLLRTIP